MNKAHNKNINRLVYSLLFLVVLPYMISIHDISYIYNIPMEMVPLKKIVLMHSKTNANNRNSEALNQDNRIKGISHFYLTCVECMNLLSPIYKIFSFCDICFTGYMLLSLFLGSSVVADIFHPPKAFLHSI